ncbi:hypothetical protein H6G33_35415 [Calothrix sp. FACHB-1219]|uniref:hypothetical protein n=1 Tax=unclassified Calothrix TaxID=2619626 RepID=UPI0016854AC3|nr:MULTISPECIES: hypothetical protein [unclassified Calothrix]MBD2207622.1 hypothetical protein [Calothrix sp. FACHB-168]MBD2222223.1 hypothetical protein [Calothrix sp. FACHB-1219]
MSKYGDLIKKVRETEPENQESGLPEDQKTKEPESQKTRKPKNQKTRKPEDQKSGLPEQELEQEEMVNLCVKVPISQRRYWMSKAKEQGITVTSVILEALKDKFGLPENQKTRNPNQ